jgi:DNA (cytosine-5)-methyltransferase 1
MSNLYTAIDLFSGSGGVTTGYKSAGIRVLAAVDIDLFSRMTYQANHPEVELFDQDLSQLEPMMILNEIKLDPGALSILTACAPCQSYSSLGRMNREESSKGTSLVERVADFVDAMLPRAIVMENVPELRRTDEFMRLLIRLSSAGYGVQHTVVNAADFGVPQRRRRLVLIGLRGVSDQEVPLLSVDHPSLSQNSRKRTVRTTLALVARFAHGDALHTVRTSFPVVVAQRIAAIPPDGGSRSSLPENLRLDCHQAMKGKRGTAAGNVYGRMRWDAPSPTLTTRCTTPACGRFLHPEENRPITVREAATLQTFPLNYSFKGQSMAVQAQIGNAVPPKLAQAIARVVTHALREMDASQGLRNLSRPHLLARD